MPLRYNAHVLRLLVGIVVLWSVAGCASPPSEAQLLVQVHDDKASSADRIRAIDRLGSHANNRLGPELMRLLDHSDGGLRHYAWIRLEAILERKLQYRPYGPIDGRRRSIRKIRIIWRETSASRGTP